MKACLYFSDGSREPIEVNVADLTVDAAPSSFADVLPGVRDTGPITIAGRWLLTNECICVVCQHPFVVNDDQPFATLRKGDEDVGPVCDPCTMALLPLTL